MAERSILTHDLAIPLPPSELDDGAPYFLFLLVSVTDVESPSTRDRIERLHHQGGANHVGVVFLLDEGTTASKNLAAMMNLQIRYLLSATVYSETLRY